MPKGERNAPVLVVDDDRADAEALRELLVVEGHPVTVAASVEEALACFRNETFGVVLSDVQLPATSGLELVTRLKAEAPATAVVMLTGHASVNLAVQALKLGAADFLQKPVHPVQLKKLVAHLVAERPAFLPNRLLAPESAGEAVFEGMLARSGLMKEVFESIELVAQTQATVLIVGETGTGKELVARAIHNRSPRADKPFVPVHMGAIPKDLIESELFGHEKGAFTGAVTAAEGKFGAAKGGTIFLDEVSTMSERAQVDLLRVLETFRYSRVGGRTEHVADLRVVCATNRDLLAMTRESTFRQDLYYRINIFPIHLPPLRQRKGDVGLLADRFMRAAAERFKRPLRAMPEESLRILEDYPWPGNVRELRNFIEQAVLLERGERLAPDLVASLLAQRQQMLEGSPQGAVISIQVGTSVAEAEHTLARRTVEVFGGDRRAAAEVLRIDRGRLDALLDEQPAPPA